MRLARHARAEVPDAPVPQAVGHARQQPVARSVDDHAVKLRVPLMPGLGIVPRGRLLHRAEELAQPPDVGARQVRHGQPRGQGLQAAPHLGDLAHGLGRHQADARGASRRHLHEVLDLEAPDGVADRHGAHAEPLREPPDRQGASGRDLAPEDLSSALGVDELVQALGARGQGRRGRGRLPPGEGAGPLREIVARVLDKGYAGYFVVEVLSQALWREDPLAVARRCHAGAVKVRSPCRHEGHRRAPRGHPRPGGAVHPARGPAASDATERPVRRTALRRASL